MQEHLVFCDESNEESDEGILMKGDFEKPSIKQQVISGENNISVELIFSMVSKKFPSKKHPLMQVHQGVFVKCLAKS